MYAKKIVYFLLILIFAVIFSSCEDSLFPSAGSYKINILVNNVTLDDCSFARSSDKIRPFFEESVTNDKDITALIVFLRDSMGDVAGQRVIYTLSKDEVSDEDIIFVVESLDDNLPFFPLPGNLSMGRYTFVSNIMSGKNILQRTEKPIYYLSANSFAYEGISVYLPGITENSHLVPKDAVLMLEANLDFDKNLDPYIIWYDGRRVIGEGKYSEGSGQFFWKAPEQSGFFTLRAEIFPAVNFDGLVGYKKGISVLVSSTEMDINLVAEDIPNLLHWYTFEGNLYDSKITDAAERALIPSSGNNSRWMGANGTYGLATGYNNIMHLPKVSVLNRAMENWQALFRFMPVNDGGLFSVQLDSSNNTNMHLSMHGRSLILTLESPSKTESQILELPDEPNNNVIDRFLTAAVNFSIRPGWLSAHISFLDNIINDTLALEPITLEIKAGDAFQILLGFLHEVTEELSDEAPESENFLPELTALWDEFALYYMPSTDILIAEAELIANENDGS
ncbi:MAG: hypothetical protein FWD40_06040 [Treponema sp.]|nr:hypothetical protein [Treponema sp.]